MKNHLLRIEGGYHETITIHNKKNDTLALVKLRASSKEVDEDFLTYYMLTCIKLHDCTFTHIKPI